jgi:hypothetical protein
VGVRRGRGLMSSSDYGNAAELRQHYHELASRHQAAPLVTGNCARDLIVRIIHAATRNTIFR